MWQVVGYGAKPAVLCKYTLSFGVLILGDIKGQQRQVLRRARRGEGIKNRFVEERPEVNLLAFFHFEDTADLLHRRKPANLLGAFRGDAPFSPPVFEA